jgi:S-formylglutathione hydrolase FrmB
MPHSEPMALAPISLLSGWAPLALQAIAAVVLIYAVGWRTRRWRLIWLPVALVVGLIAAALTYWYIQWSDLSSGRLAPYYFWIWVVLGGVALAVLFLGWRDTNWWRRGASMLAVPLCLLCVAVALNMWTGYVPTLQTAYDQLAGRPVAGQTDAAGVKAIQDKGGIPQKGTVMTVTIPDNGSGFKHRDEVVYLPPAWYASNPPPKLPVVMMIGGVIGRPGDWLRAGDAQKTLDDFAAKHGGNAPVVVFVDVLGAFLNDTECVNSPRGNAADHLTKDVVPYMISKFGVSADPANWGVAGFSMGGTCAVTLAMKYPELFSSFVDIGGDLFPRDGGGRDETIARLFNGDEEAFKSWEPASVIQAHGPYPATAGWFVVGEQVPNMYRPPDPNPGSVPLPEPPTTASDHAGAAQYLCELASDYGVECAVVSDPGKHDWPSAASAFPMALPWLAGRLGTPGVPPSPMPGAPGSS